MNGEWTGVCIGVMNSNTCNFADVEFVVKQRKLFKEEFLRYFGFCKKGVPYFLPVQSICVCMYISGVEFGTKCLVVVLIRIPPPNISKIKN